MFLLIVKNIVILYLCEYLKLLSLYNNDLDEWELTQTFM